MLFIFFLYTLGKNVDGFQSLLEFFEALSKCIIFLLCGVCIVCKTCITTSSTYIDRQNSEFVYMPEALNLILPKHDIV